MNLHRYAILAAILAPLLAGCAADAGDPHKPPAPVSDAGTWDEVPPDMSLECFEAVGCWTVPRCPDADAGSCYLEADKFGRLVSLWTCPETVASVDADACAALARAE